MSESCERVATVSCACVHLSDCFPVEGHIYALLPSFTVKLAYCTACKAQKTFNTNGESQKRGPKHEKIPVISSQAIYRVRTGPGKPGKSWNFIMAFSRTGKSWKKATGPGKFWKSVNSAKNMKCMGSSKEN